jgi:RimJ/RimL family protein N-acetyltransferase
MQPRHTDAAPPPGFPDLELFSAPPSIAMRLARPSDAEYIHGLRMDPAYNQHLSTAVATVEAQRNFLVRYQESEARGREYYFVIDNKSKQLPCGVVRVYDLRPDSFSWGSWILDHNKPRRAAIESAMFVYDFGYGVLGYQSSHFEVRRGNTPVISFHERFGAVRTSEDELNVYFRLDVDNYRRHLPQFVELTGYRPLRLAP